MPIRDLPSPGPALLLFMAGAACTATPSLDGQPPEPRCADGKCDVVASDAPRLCAAIRGNGENIFAHFGSLARIVEHYGPVDALAGGSSGSITSFLTESIALQPAVYECGERDCDNHEIAARTAFLLKSVHGYIDQLGETDEGLALQQIGPIAARIKSEGIADLAVDDALAARDALVTLLSSDDLRDLINPELLTLLRESPDPAFHVRDILDAVSNITNWDPNSDRILIRPGILNFRGFADKLGRAGSFYAGYGPADDDAMAALLDDCASASRGLDWNQTAELAASEASCGATFADLVDGYRDAWGDGTSFSSRADDYVGEYLPALISTSIFRGETRQSFAVARANYQAARPYSFSPNFGDLRFGYWGHPVDLDRVSANTQGYRDQKTLRFASLGPATWRTVMSLSPAEPGLARALEVDGATVSAGGWSDLAPTLVLQNLGCERVVYVTRKGEESGFARGVAKLLGMSDAQDRALFSLDSAESPQAATSDSALALSIREADGVWCTDWNAYSGFPIEPIWQEAYSAQLVTQDAFFSTAALPYGNLSSAPAIQGCSSR